MRQLRLALKMLRRDLRAGELNLLLISLLIAVSCSTAIGLFSDRLQRTMQQQAGEFLAADLAVSSASPMSATWLEQAGQLGLQQSQTLEFNSVLLENQQMLLASVKAVSAEYPLRGALKTSSAAAENPETVRHGPPPGEVWVENRLLPALSLKLGDNLTIGEAALTISRVLNYEPDKRSNFYSFAPRVMMNQQDIAAAAVIQPGSHVQYVYQFSGAETAVVAFKTSLSPQLAAGQRLLDIHTDRPELGSALQRTEQYLGLSGVIVVLIAGVAIAMSTQRYSERHFNTTALLRCLGSQQRDIFRLFGWQFLLLAGLGSVAGCLLGWLAQLGLFYLLAPLLPHDLASPGWAAYVLGFAGGIVIFMGFALPPLLRLQRVPPLRVLRRDLAPLPSSAILVYALAAALTAVLIWRYTADLRMTALILGIGALTLLALSALIYALLKLTAKLLAGISLKWRFGLQGLTRNSRSSIGQILAFSITLTALALSFAVRNDLLDNWLKQVPADAPNYFALNIFPNEIAGFQEYLQENTIAASRLYPVVRGRLTAINAQPVQQRVSKDSQGEAATQRELSLTWADTLPADNQILAGTDWQPQAAGQVSIEQKLAESLKIQPGDQLTFAIGSEQLTAIVSNIRSVHWDTMRPNFYMIFSPGTLDAYPSTYLTSFYVPDGQKHRINGLLKKFPATTILEVDLILQQFKTMLAQVTAAINLLLGFAALAGIMVLFATVYAGLDQRRYEAAMLRTLGASRGFLRTTQLLEFSLLGALAGLLAAVAAEAILYSLYSQVLHMDYRPSYYLWAVLPAAGVFIVAGSGLWGVRQVVNQTPLLILKRQS